MDKIDFKIISKSDAGNCPKCGIYADKLFVVELAADNKTKRMSLCVDCAKKLYEIIIRKNSDGSAYTQKLSMPSALAWSDYQEEFEVITLDPLDSCPDCGSPIYDQSIFCSNCGALIRK